MNLRKGEIVELDILDAAESDSCMGKLPDGMVVFVKGMSAPGDRVQAAFTKIKKTYLEARLVHVVSPSADRVPPVCAHYGVCGGCKWQHLSYERQLQFKRKLVNDALVHIGGFEGAIVRNTVGCEERYHYRNKVDFTFSNERFILEDELELAFDARSKPSDFALGFHRPGLFHKVIDIDRCHIATDASSHALALTREFFLRNRRPAYSTVSHEGYLRNLVVRHAGTTGQLMVNIITSWFEESLMREYCAFLRDGLGDVLTTVINSTTLRKNLVAYGDESHVLYGPGSITEILDGLSFVVSPNSFFQTNSGQALVLYRIAKEYAALLPQDVLFDLYCGTGSITLFAGRDCRLAHGFELEASSVADAVRNAERNSMAHCSFTATDMKHLRVVMQNAGAMPDVVITDPPRAGMHEDAIETLRALAPRRIVYVSCHPASLARDGKALCAGGMYRLAEVQPVDLFPQTFHVESVARFEKN